MSDRLTCIEVHLPQDTLRYLDKVKTAGGHPSRSALVRSLLGEIKRDDEAAHGEFQSIGDVASRVVESLQRQRRDNAEQP